MNNILRIAAVAVSVSAVFAACDTLNQTAQSSFDTASVFSNEALTRQAVNAIYQTIPANSFSGDFVLYYGGNSDVESIASYGEGEVENIWRYEISPSNSKLNFATTSYLYGGHYSGIERANLAVKGLKEFGQIDTKPEMAKLYAEALTVRALLYINLLNNYGEIPARFEPSNADNLYLPKSDKDVIYRHILADLEEAASLMEYKDQTVITQCGKAAANGLYARIAMQAAGYSCRPDTVNTGSMGKVRLSYSEDLQAKVLYPKALKACEDIIKNAGLSLYENFEDIWKFYCNRQVEAGHEIIFGLPMGTTGWHMIRNAVPDSHFFAPNAASSPYNVCQPNLYFRYDPDDLRRDVTCYPAKIDASGHADGSGMNINYMYYGKYRFYWMVDNPIKTNTEYDCAKFTYLRYADILLMAAELANELSAADGGGLEKAKSYMRPVLVRAYGSETKADAYLAKLTDHDSFFDAIKDQRAFEFAGELLRKYDLIRWGILKQTLDECVADLRDLKNLKGRYAGMKNVIYYRFKPNGIDLELYGTNPSETEDKTVTDPTGGWSKKTSYFSGLRDVKFSIYKQNPDEKMYRPIPETVITQSMGVLVNDYGY